MTGERWALRGVQIRADLGRGKHIACLLLRPSFSSCWPRHATRWMRVSDHRPLTPRPTEFGSGSST